MRVRVASIKQPVSMLRADGKRSDGLTLSQWQARKNAIWDITVADTMAIAYSPSMSVTADSAAEIAVLCKERKYI